MAENKKSFVLYSDQRTLIELLNNEQAGVLLKHIFAYVNDENPVCTDQLINIAFEPIKQQFKRDLIKWEATKEGRSKAGLASAEARRINKLQQTSTNVNNVQQTSTNSTVNDNVNVNVNVNDNVKKDINTFDFKKSCIDFGFKSELVNDWLKVRKNKKLTNTETAFKKFINQVELNGQDKNLILEKCIEKSWGGFESDWFKDEVIHEVHRNLPITLKDLYE
jgi:hypothetical protein